MFCYCYCCLIYLVLCRFILFCFQKMRLQFLKKKLCYRKKLFKTNSKSSNRLTGFDRQLTRFLSIFLTSCSTAAVITVFTPKFCWYISVMFSFFCDFLFLTIVPLWISSRWFVKFFRTDDDKSFYRNIFLNELEEITFLVEVPLQLFKPCPTLSTIFRRCPFKSYATVR